LLVTFVKLSIQWKYSTGLKAGSQTVHVGYEMMDPDELAA